MEVSLQWQGRRAARIWWILRYHRPEQLCRRLWKHCIQWAPPKPVHSAGALTLRGFDQTWNRYAGSESKNTFAELARGNVTLLNIRRELGAPIDWTLAEQPDVPALWRFQLHYHEYLAARSPALTDWDVVDRVLDHWIESYPTPTKGTVSDAWHPYCISRRLPVWATLCRNAPYIGRWRRRLDHFARQADFLAQNLERDLGGNHLWENAKALAIAGSFLRGPAARRWRRLGTALLCRCIGEQISREGEHFERSPMYQHDLADGLMDASRWLEEIDPHSAMYCEDAAARMSSFLDEIRHPDGGAPLFGDTSLQQTPSRSIYLPDGVKKAGDYLTATAGGGKHRLIFDAGNLGPDHLPAHAHSDLLGFELSAHGERFLVDSGVYCYAGPLRQQYRRSAAHNVLTVDGAELADTWSSFRMGRRGHVTAKKLLKHAGGAWFVASHDAYGRQGVRVVRVWHLTRRGPWISVHLVLGEGCHEIAEHLHWHPDVSVALAGNQARATGKRGELTWERAVDLNPITANLNDGLYSPDFYVEHVNQVLTLAGTVRLPALCAWAVGFDGQQCHPRAVFDGSLLTVSWTHDCNRERASLDVDAFNAL